MNETTYTVGQTYLFATFVVKGEKGPEYYLENIFLPDTDSFQCIKCFTLKCIEKTNELVEEIVSKVNDKNILATAEDVRFIFETIDSSFKEIPAGTKWFKNSYESVTPLIDFATLPRQYLEGGEVTDVTMILSYLYQSFLIDKYNNKENGFWEIAYKLLEHLIKINFDLEVEIKTINLIDQYDSNNKYVLFRPIIKRGSNCCI